MKHAFAMTVMGRRDLTKQCLETFYETLPMDVQPIISVVDAATGTDMLQAVDLAEFFERTGKTEKFWFSHEPNVGISAGWNSAIRAILKHEKELDNLTIWLLNNDVVFKKKGWLEKLTARLEENETSMVGSYAMSVFGHRFVTGGIWGFRVKHLAYIASFAQVLDETMNLSMQDVDLSVRFTEAGYEIADVPGIEFGEDPYLVHLISQTQLVTYGSQKKLYKAREPERRAFLDKHGRKDGKTGYEGVVEEL